MKIGIGLTTHNRNEVARETFENIKKFAPEGAKIVVVDDASKEPFKGATHRFNVNVGVAQAKNKCLELLDDCDFIFLFDDDTYPCVKGWWLPYVTSGINHLCMTFDKHSNGLPTGRKLLKTEGDFCVYEKPCGCMLFLTKKCLKIAGGFDIRFHKYGFEHVEYSSRIHNLGLTPYRFMDVKNSTDLFVSLDYESKVFSSVRSKRGYILANGALYNKNKHSKEFKPYKEKAKPKHGNVVLTSFFNYGKDPQRGVRWKADKNELKPLIESCVKYKQKLIIFSNCFESEKQNKYVEFIKVGASKTHCANVYRRIVYEEWMRENDFTKCWMVDSTDVEMLKNPFPIIRKEKLYVGDEAEKKTENDWMRRRQEIYIRSKIKDYKKIIRAHGSKPLLNAGLVGGYKEVILPLMTLWAQIHRENTARIKKSTDMAVFNYIMRKYYDDIIVHGEQINTRFKGYETNNKVAIWKHK